MFATKKLLEAAVIAGAAVLAGCAPSDTIPTLTWHVNPDNGTQAELAAKCSALADGRYRIRTALLPRDSTAQREQLVRRLAAGDSGIDLMSLDVPYLAEFANAGFLRRFSDAERDVLVRGMLHGPLASARWEDGLYGVPFNANTQLLWVRRQVARDAGLDLGEQLTWNQVIDAAERTKTKVHIQARRYEGYTVLINSLIASAGGSILQNPEAGTDALPALDSPAGEAAARVIQRLSASPAAPTGMGNADEGVTQARFRGRDAGFMINWPFVYTAERGKPLQEDFGWSRWPAVDAGKASRPPLGGINLAIGAFSRHPDSAVEAVACITTPESQKQYMLGEGLLATVESVYDEPEIQASFPMAGLLRDSLADAAPRPLTPYYPDITTAIQTSWHPPDAVDERTPAASAQFIADVLGGRKLL
jgi:multiple sugar transport system substrate-binding protein